MTRKRKTKAPTPGRGAELAGFSALAVLSGTLWFLACASFDIWPLAWIASIPSLYTIERAGTTRRAVFYACLTGLTANAGGFYWITKLLTRFAHLSPPVAIFAYLLMSAYQGLAFGLFAWAYRRIRQLWALPVALVAPLVMVAAELAWPMLFPWYLAITQAWQPHVIQIADLTGPLGVSALLLAVNGALYELLSARRWKPAVVVAATLVAALGYGELRLRQMDEAIAAAPHAKVGIVQGNVPFSEKGYEHPDRAAQQLDDLKDRSQKLEAAGAELILWTETAFPYILPRTMTAEPLPLGIRSKDGKRLFKAPLVFGALTLEVDASGHRAADKDPYNTAILLTPDGKLADRFDKMFLVMFSEHIPLVESFPWLRKVLPDNSGNLTPGDGVKLFHTTLGGRDVKLAPMICFEDIISKFSILAGRLHPDLLVNITNDAWFGNTSEPWEHMALSVFRAVEVRSALVRAVNTGVSALIDPAGRVVSKSYAIDPLEEPAHADTLLVDAPLLEGGHTVYVTVGDVFGYLCAAAALLLWLVLPRWRRARA